MEYEEKVEYAIKDITSRLGKKLNKKILYPYEHRLLGKLGIKLPPPHFQGFFTNMFLLGISFSIFVFLPGWFAWKWLILRNEDINWVFPTYFAISSLGGIGFGLWSAIELRRQATLLRLPSWDKYPEIKEGKMGDRFCTQCGSNLSDGAKYCPSCATLTQIIPSTATPPTEEKIYKGEITYKKPEKRKLWLIALGVLVMLYLVGHYNSGNKLGGSNTSFTERKVNSDLRLVSSEWGTTEYGGNAIVGIVENNSDKPFRYVQISYNLYDITNNQIGTAFANVNNLEPRGRWKFRALVLEKNVHDAKLKDLSGR